MDEQQHRFSNPQPNMQAYSGMQPAGQYHSNSHHPPDSYRASPSQQQHSHGTPLLPPIHDSYEGSTMQSQQPYLPQQMNGAQMPHPPPYNAHQFQYPNGAMQPAPMLSNAGMNGQRFAIPPQAAIPIAAARGAKNKEVRRRTKTGCLTCRKRRIKCDEAQPSCRNCAKSKRECMGYDPIFKQTTGPALIQPAPASATTPTPKSTPTSATLPSNTYQSFPATGGTFIATPSNASQSHFDSTFEYGPSLDPALGPGDAGLTMAANSYSSPLQPSRQVKHISMDQLFSLNGVAPQYQKRDAPPPGPASSQAEIDNYYKFHYAPGLDRILETTWYSTRGLGCLQQDPSLLDFLSQCMERMTSSNDEASLRSLEARLVWKLATLPRSTSNTNGMNGASTDQLTSDLLPRIDTLESLLTGQFLPESSIPPQGDPSPQSSHSFWHSLGYFTSIHDDTSNPENHQNIKDALIWLRGILERMENRDVLYSIAIARYIGGRLPEFNPPNRVSPQTDDPNDEVKKLQIAHDFVASEDQKGTTQVIQRICGMAMRSWMLQKQ